MANPLDAFKGLKKWQQGAVVVGGVVVVGGFVVYERKAKAAAAATPAAAPAAAVSASVAGMVTDPTTGQSYPVDDTDPVSGLTYGIEIQEYGSVAAADEEASGGAAAEEGLTQTEYDEETGQGSGSGGATASNAQWVAEVESALSQLGYSDADIQQGLARYFSSSPQGTAADGTNLYNMMETAIGEFGPPPSGTYALIKGGATPGPGADSVTVPDEVGREDLATAEAAIKAAGLVPHAAGDSGAGNKGKVTAQDPAAGSSVSKGSGVTLTYTVSGSTPPAPGDVTVPNAVGRKDLSTAEAVIRKAGLTPKAAGDSPAGNKGSVTSQDPAAGAKVAKGAVVTLTYTTAPSKTNVHV
jgi:hypothetical protein